MKWLVLFPNIKDGYSPYRPASLSAQTLRKPVLCSCIGNELAPANVIRPQSRHLTDDTVDLNAQALCHAVTVTQVGL